jgi:hypothetical protein
MKATRVTEIIVAGLVTLPAFADTRFPLRRMGRNDGPPSRGQCVIRLQVDNQVEVVLDREQAFVRTLAGQDARDEGSECSAPLPGREVAGFNLEVLERRGDVQLVEAPSRRNDGKVIIRVRDGQGGFGRYIFRVSWALEGSGPPPDARRDGDERRPPDGRYDDRRPDDRRPDGDVGRGDIRIISAFWGAPGRNRDVTRLLQERMRDGRLRIRASNDEMGVDPAYGSVKALTVVYEMRGRKQEVKVPEGDYLELP